MKGGTTGPHVNSTRHLGQWRGGPANIKGANRSPRCGLLSSLSSPPPHTPTPAAHIHAAIVFFFIHLFIYLWSEETGGGGSGGRVEAFNPIIQGDAPGARCNFSL